MENKIMMPASYNVLSCEEMTYTEGGVGVVEAAMAWFPLYGWYKAVSAIHDYRKANINSNWVENGMNALVLHQRSGLCIQFDRICKGRILALHLCKERIQPFHTFLKTFGCSH